MFRSLALVPVLSITAAANGATIFVDAANCPGPGDGSIGDPYCEIQTAIDNAVDTDEVVVAPGTYFETINFLDKAITLRSTDPNDAGVVLNTIINGGASGTVVICNSGEGANTVLSGFTITGGNASEGGGMLNDFSSPGVTNCTFIGNTATGNGGGMFNENSSATVTNCTFVANAANFGGGMYSINGSPTVTNCTFVANAANFGGGMFNVSSNPTVTNCTFCGNDPDDISGGFVDGGGNIFNRVCPDGACCLNDSCIVAAEANCIAARGTYQGDNTLCEALTCPTPCPADVTGDGDVGINDFLDLLAAWGPCK